jgi:hypothetical protein
MDFIKLYTEVCLAWVAFSAIVATLRQTLGGSFTSLQYVMFRFFVECSLIHFMTALTTFAFLDVLDDEQAVWRASTVLIMAGIIFFLPFHIRRRLRLGVRMPLVSRITMVGYIALFFALSLALLEIWWKPSLGLMATTFIFGMVSNTLLFMHFLGSFVVVKDDPIVVA